MPRARTIVGWTIMESKQYIFATLEAEENLVAEGALSHGSLMSALGCNSGYMWDLRSALKARMAPITPSRSL